MPYTAFIDGLRAIAVLAVVAYHAGVPGPSGGFIGVDIFFVISGYLIIGQIVTQVERGEFSFSAFWSRRALRILPPYFLVVFTACVVATYVLVLPDEYAEFGWEVVWSALMVVNHYFLDQQGYFDSAAELKPLLHLWSLAVEEQFYLVAPVALVALAMLRRRAGSGWAGLSVAAAFVASFGLCVWFTTAIEDKNYAFYLMPLRAWEFMAGGMAGYLAMGFARLGRRPAEIAALLALGSLVYLIFRIDTDLDFPSYVAAGPVAATTLLIAIGLAHRDLVVIRLLASTPMVAVGLVSYSWYLWHWPVMAFARIYNFERLPLSWGVAAAGASLLLAIATYFALERPIRRWRQRTDAGRGWRPVGAGAAVAALVAAIGLYVAVPYTGALQSRLPAWTFFEREYPTDACALNTVPDARACLDLAGGKPIGLLIGDSHGRAIWRTLQAQAEANGFHLATLIGSGCVGFFETRKFSRFGTPIRAGCLREYENAQRLLAELEPRFAVMATRWLTYADGSRVRERDKIGPAGALEPASDQRAYFIAAARRTVEILAQSGVQRVLVLGPVPEIRPDPPTCVLRADHYGISRARHCGESKRRSLSRRTEAVSRLDEAFAGDGRVALVDPFELLCSGRRCLPFVERNGPVVYRDFNHLNSIGAAAVFAAFDTQMTWLLADR